MVGGRHRAPAAAVPCARGIRPDLAGAVSASAGAEEVETAAGPPRTDAPAENPTAPDRSAFDIPVRETATPGLPPALGDTVADIERGYAARASGGRRGARAHAGPAGHGEESLTPRSVEYRRRARPADFSGSAARRRVGIGGTSASGRRRG